MIACLHAYNLHAEADLGTLPHLQRFRTHPISKMELFVATVYDWNSLPVVINSFSLVVTAVLT